MTLLVVGPQGPYGSRRSELQTPSSKREVKFAFWSFGIGAWNFLREEAT